jgi:hypothetical protein
MISLLAWPLAAFCLLCAYPWARWLLAGERDGILLLTTTFALSIGVLTLAMLWLGLSGQPITWGGAATACILVFIAGYLVGGQFPPKHNAHTPDSPYPTALRTLSRFALAVIVLVAALILFNASYWPFAIDDAVTIYAMFGKRIALTGALPTGDLYETYPMLIPLAYAFTHQAAGWIDEGLAGAITALLALGVLPTAYLLGKTLYAGLDGRAIGLCAALLIALTPMFAQWASAGYADLPVGFFYGLSTLFCARLAAHGGWRNALLAGLMAGLAAWTKNSGLLVVPAIGLWLLSRLLTSPRRGLLTRHALIIAAGFLAVAAPWYARNLIMAGLVVPPTGWTWLAQRTLANLFPYLITPYYLPIGVLFTLGLLHTLWRAARGEPQSRLLAIFYLPFFAAWWLLVSYDVRFLFALTPLIALMAGRLTWEIYRRALARLTLPHARLLAALSLFVIALLALPAAWIAVDHKAELLRRPLMSDAERHRVRLGPRYDMALYVRGLPSSARVWTDDGLLPYHAYTPDGPTVIHGGPPAPGDAYDFFAVQPGTDAPAWLGSRPPIYEVGGYRLYKAP